jgi:hypothetical protein
MLCQRHSPLLAAEHEWTWNFFKYIAVVECLLQGLSYKMWGTAEVAIYLSRTESAMSSFLSNTVSDCLKAYNNAERINPTRDSNVVNDRELSCVSEG